jgi:hypothetical protein
MAGVPSSPSQHGLGPSIPDRYPYCNRNTLQQLAMKGLFFGRTGIAAGLQAGNVRPEPVLPAVRITTTRWAWLQLDYFQIPQA